MESGQKQLVIIDMGVIDYDLAYAFQRQCVNKVLDGGDPVLLFCEHPAVLTKGRMTKPEHILFRQQDLANCGITVQNIDRGGDVTLHAPGQLVIYPIINLTEYGKDLKVYLRALEEMSMAVLIKCGIKARREPGNTGVWADKKKIVSIGIGVKRWISFHGVAINVNTDLSLFSCIKPCGLNVEMTSMSEILGFKLEMQEIKEKVTEEFLNVFKFGKGCTGEYTSERAAVIS